MQGKDPADWLKISFIQLLDFTVNGLLPLLSTAGFYLAAGLPHSGKQRLASFSVPVRSVTLEKCKLPLLVQGKVPAYCLRASFNQLLDFTCNSLLAFTVNGLLLP